MNWTTTHIILYLVLPALITIIVLYVYIFSEENSKANKKYQVHFKLKQGKFKIDNVRRGVSIIGSAGSGKTESVVYNLLQHFAKYNFCGIIHDYKDFELTEIAYPLFKDKDVDFYTISFDKIYHRANPIAPRYLPNEESVNEVFKVLIENLLEQNLYETSGSSKFFMDAVEGLLSGLIWKLKTAYPQLCTLPHLITLYQTMSTKKLVTLFKI
nr:hypothetical protein BACY1_00140 [Tenacibaculum mesophilum]